jgi:hypothetical protein
MKNIIRVILCIFLFTISVKASESWQTVVHKNFNFSYLSPGKAELQIDTIGNSCYSYIWMVSPKDTNDLNLYYIQVIDNIGEVVSDSSDEYIIELLKSHSMESFSDSAGYQLIDRKRSEIGSFLGLKSKFLNKKTGVGVEYFNFAVKNRVYSFFTMQLINTVDNDNLQKFFNNIKLVGIENTKNKPAKVSSKSCMKVKFNKEPLKREDIVDATSGSVPIRMLIDTSDSRCQLATMEYDFSALPQKFNSEDELSELFTSMQLKTIENMKLVEQSKQKLRYKNLFGMEYTSNFEKENASVITRYFYINAHVVTLTAYFSMLNADRKSADEFFNSMEIIEE